MTNKQYLNEAILKTVLKKLDDLKQQSQTTQTINLCLIQTLVDQAQQSR